MRLSVSQGFNTPLLYTARMAARSDGAITPNSLTSSISLIHKLAASDGAAILPHVDVFMPNETELKAITRTDDLSGAISRIRPYLRQVAVIKCGSRGSLLVKKDGEVSEMPSFLNSHVVDSIGAGDSFNAGFIYGYVKGMSLTECQRLGNLTGAVNTTAAGGTGAFTSREAVIRTAREVFGADCPL